jgi:hypothetical protein
LTDLRRIPHREHAYEDRPEKPLKACDGINGIIRAAGLGVLSARR